MLPVLMAVIDRDRDGGISAGEEQAYVDRVAREVELRVDGVPARLSLIESSFPALEAMREGMGTIRIKLHAARMGRQLRFENRHLPQVSTHTWWCLAAPADGLVVGRQDRDEAQRSIAFEYSLGRGAVAGQRAAWIAMAPFWPAAIVMLLVVRMVVLLYRAQQQKRASKSSPTDIHCESGHILPSQIRPYGKIERTCQFESTENC